MGTSVGLDVGVMWRLSEDLNVARRFAARVQQHHSIHRSSVSSSMIYNGKNTVKFSLCHYQESVFQNIRPPPV